MRSSTRISLVILLLAIVSMTGFAQSGISAFAGIAAAGFSGDGGKATLAQGKWVAYAIANPGNDTIDIEISLAGLDGTGIGDTVAFSIGPKQQVAKYLSQDLAMTRFSGILTIRARAGATFAAVALLDNQGLLTALPLESGKTQASTK